MKDNTPTHRGGDRARERGKENWKSADSYRNNQLWKLSSKGVTAAYEICPVKVDVFRVLQHIVYGADIRARPGGLLFLACILWCMACIPTYLYLSFSPVRVHFGGMGYCCTNRNKSRQGVTWVANSGLEKNGILPRSCFSSILISIVWRSLAIPGPSDLSDFH